MKRKLCQYEIIFLYIFSFIYTIYDFSILFEPFIGKQYRIIIGVVNIFFVFIICKKKLLFNNIYFLIFLLVLTINSSFTSITGSPYSTIPVTWFLIAALCIIYICNKRIYPSHSFKSVVMFMLFGGVSIVCRSDNYKTNAFNQYLNIIIFLLFLASTYKLTKIIYQNLPKYLEILYLNSVLSFSIMIIVQKVFYEYFSLEVGNIGKYYMRISYSATFSDHSFSSLYIATGICTIFANLCYKKQILPKLATIVYMVIYLYAILAVNARTGPVTLILCVFTMLNYLIINYKKNRLLLIEVCLLPIALSILIIMTQNRAGGFFNASGRGISYMTGFLTFLDHIIFGSGLGIANYVAETQTVIPHNFFVQYLAQLGLVGFAIILYGINQPIQKMIKRKGSPAKWTILTMIIGAMLIPDIISSHYLYPLIIIASSDNDSHHNKFCNHSI